MFWTHPLFQPHWGCDDAAASQNAGGSDTQAQLRFWGIDSDPKDIPMLLLPWPLAFLTSHHKWSRLLLLTRWHPMLRLR